MLAFWVVLICSQDLKPTTPVPPSSPALAVIAKTPGATRTEKALNYVENMCRLVAAQVAEKKSVTAKEKERVQKELATMAKVFATARKETTEANYSEAMGAMSRFLLTVVRSIPGQDFSGERAVKLRESCAKLLDEMRPGVILPEDLEGFIAKAKGENAGEKTIRGVGLFCQAIRDSIQTSEKLPPSQEEKLLERWNALATLGNDRLTTKGALSPAQWQELVQANLDYFAAVHAVTKSDNRHGQNWRLLHNACLRSLETIKP